LSPTGEVQMPRMPPCEQLVDWLEYAVPCALCFGRVDMAPHIILSRSDGLVIEGKVF
jgi:hypothetical protein